MEMTPSGYEFHSFPRLGQRGGGIAVVTKLCLGSLSVKRLAYVSVKAVDAKLVQDDWSASFV